MNWLRNWWRSWKQLEAETDLHMGRDERYLAVRNDATRIGALTFPFTFIAALIAGAIWLPDPIGKEDVLHLGVAVLVVAVLVSLGVRRVLIERKDIGWVDPELPAGKYLLYFILFYSSLFVLVLLSPQILDRPSQWGTFTGLLAAGVISLLIYARRWRRDQQARDD